MDAAVHTHKDYQEDMNFLFTSQAVSKHTRDSVTMMICYPTVLEIFKIDESKELNDVAHSSHTKNKNFETVEYFGEQCIDDACQLRYNILRYDCNLDQCSNQFWCYGSFQHLVNMLSKLNIAKVNKYWYKRYER